MVKQEEWWQISHRLQTIATYIPDHMRVADIGGDHAYLLLSVAHQGRLGKGIVGEVNRGPFETAREHVRMLGYDQLIDVRHGDGLAVLQANEVDVIVIAGMGGALIADILDAGKEKLTSVQRLILQPNIGEHRVRMWLEEHHFRIVDETIVEDADILYEIIVAEPANGETFTPPAELTREQWLIVGPILWTKHHPLLQKKLQQEQMGRRKVLAQLERGKTESALQRKEELQREIEEWERMMAWLPEAKS